MPISNLFILFLLLAVLVLESSTTSTLKDPSSFPGSKHHRLKRADDFTGRLLTTDNDDVDDKKGPQIESVGPTEALLTQSNNSYLLHGTLREGSASG